MMAREKRLGFGEGQPPYARGSWLIGLVVGMTVTNLAAGAMMLGASAAISNAIVGKTITPRRPSSH